MADDTPSTLDMDALTAEAKALNEPTAAQRRALYRLRQDKQLVGRLTKSNASKAIGIALELNRLIPHSKQDTN